MVEVACAGKMRLVLAESMLPAIERAQSTNISHSSCVFMEGDF